MAEDSTSLTSDGDASRTHDEATLQHNVGSEQRFDQDEGSLGQLKFLWFQKARHLSDLKRFDEAANGALGALKLLWALRTRHIITSIGSILVLISLLLVPFTQQLLDFYPCLQIDLSNKATIPRSNLVRTLTNESITAGIGNVDYGAQAAVIMGITDDEPAQVSPFCPSGNCTFTEEYASGGYCSYCKDVTDEIEVSEHNITIPGWGIATNGANSAFALELARDGFAGVRMLYSWLPYMVVNRTADRCDGGIRGGNWTCLGRGAAECYIVPCVRRYKASVKQGVLGENITSLVVALNRDYRISTALSVIDMKCINSTERALLREEGHSIFDASTEWLLYNTSQPGFPSLRSECIYEGDRMDTGSLMSYFEDVFSGSIGTQKGSLGRGDSFLGGALFNFGDVSFASISKRFDNLADALTVYVRGRYSIHPVEGNVQKAETCVKVRWPWITLAAVVLVLGVGFYAGTLWMVRCTRDDTVRHDFKTSLLPLLFHGLEGKILEAYSQDSQTVSSINHHAEDLRVRLVKDERGWGFKEEAI
ncbi:hypothetical protein B0T10DRAFT_607365 [Thelonectria olida]|uniref:Uncharacterized protein n=1 Tax=Thelonectria olida TaxID=1576542 RepID=A0A9P8W2W6_9HYPO|nr:hypothetical protein B0T10DRAFT_607365 [Thelonectria olida]